MAVAPELTSKSMTDEILDLVDNDTDTFSTNQPILRNFH